MKKEIGVILVALLFFIPAFVIIGNVKLVAFDLDFYSSQFDSYNPDVENPLLITSDLHDFIYESENDESKVSAFEKNEISHLIDVKRLIHKFLLLLYVSGLGILFGLVSLYYLDKKNFFKNLGIFFSLGGVFTLLLTFVLIVLFSNFETAWISFHEIFFSINWQFDGNSLLIILYPISFWMAMVSKILIHVVVSANLLIVLGILMLLERKYNIFHVNR